MDKRSAVEYIGQTYGVTPDCPFSEDFETCVFRHPQNRKWFGIYMVVKAEKFGLEGEDVEVVNFKAEPIIASSVIDGKAVFPAYHMNRNHWVSVLLGKVDENTFAMLADISFELTLPKERKRK